MKLDLVIKNARIVRVSKPGIYTGHCLVHEGRILKICRDLPEDLEASSTLDAQGKLLIPGFVDCHTHLVHSGQRSNELMLRLDGAPYQNIQKLGGGIYATVNATRAATEEELYQESLERAKLCLAHGSTTVEIKTGYGLSPEQEEKIFKVIKRLKDSTPLDILLTFLGAHVFPQDMSRGSYLDWLLTDGMRLAKKYAEFVDVYCDTGAFTLDETEKIFHVALAHDLKLKVHSGQFKALGASGLACRLGAVSADHLDQVSDNEFECFKQSRTIPVFLPGCSYYLKSAYPNARPWLDAGMDVACATDYNPGTCPSLSIPMIMSLAVMHMGFTPEEALKAVTLNAAKALDRDNIIGSIDAGKQADLLLLSADNAAGIISHFGVNLVDTVVKKGKIV